MSPLIASTRRARDEQETEFARIVAFSDGVLAIAATILVFTIDAPARLMHAPNLPDALSGLRYQILAYFLSFAVIAWLWVVHHRMFGRLTHFDRNLIVLNLVYLGLVAFIDLLKPEERALALHKYRQLFFVPLIFLGSIPIAFVSTWGAIAFWALILIAHPSGLSRLLKA